MGWSLKLGTVAGIRVQMHFTFVIFMAWIVLSGLVQGKSREAALVNAVFMMALFGCVVLHELGHALMAKHFGIVTKDITLLPIGGVARVERMPDEPWQELLIALAGPFVNVVIAALLWVWLQTAGQPFDLANLDLGSATFAQRLILVNVSLTIFNLLPAFPMDGGRIARALLATRLPYTRATEIAASLGQGLAILFGVVGFFYNPMMMFIALFVWMGAAQEAAMVQMKAALAGIPVQAAMVTAFDTVEPGDTLDHMVSLVLKGAQHDFPVVEGGLVVGIVTRTDLLKALATRKSRVVGDIMRRDIALAEASDMLENVVARLQESACHTIPVLRDGRLAGLLTADNLAELLLIRSARGATKVRPSIAVRGHV